MNHPLIHAIGTANPPHRIAQGMHLDILEHANGMSREQQLILRRIYSRSGIEHRHSVLPEFSMEDGAEHLIFHPSGAFEATSVAKRMEIYEQHAAGLCVEAASHAINAIPGLEKSRITHLVTFSCTGIYAPGIDIALTEALGMSRTIERTCINFMGCYAAINALKVAWHIARSEPKAVILVAGVEICSIHYQRSYEANQMVANALFGDGAAAAIVSADDLGGATEMRLRLKDFSAVYQEKASNDMVWRIGNVGFDLLLSPEVPKIVRENIGPLMEGIYQRNGLTGKGADFYAIHPGGTKILEACEQALSLSAEQNEVSYGILRDFGNMSSVTILFVLQRYIAEKLTDSDKGKTLLACAFGPGITMEAMLVEII